MIFFIGVASYHIWEALHKRTDKNMNIDTNSQLKGLMLTVFLTVAVMVPVVVGLRWVFLNSVRPENTNPPRSADMSAPLRTIRIIDWILIYLLVLLGIAYIALLTLFLTFWSYVRQNSELFYGFIAVSLLILFLGVRFSFFLDFLLEHNLYAGDRGTGVTRNDRIGLFTAMRLSWKVTKSHHLGVLLWFFMKAICFSLSFSIPVIVLLYTANFFINIVYVFFHSTHFILPFLALVFIGSPFFGISLVTHSLGFRAAAGMHLSGDEASGFQLPSSV